jgi:phage/conjugal plasmid C-4 type zinc finger TraR family protein
MADIIDEANERTELYVAQAIDRARMLDRDSVCGFEVGACQECGGKIPEKRRRAAPGCRRCVECQMDFEQGG